MRVLLVSMPWHALERPSLGLSLLRAALERDGHECTVKYLGFDFADSIGIEDYLWVHSGLPYTAFAGDWLFTQALYGPRPQLDREYLDVVVRRQWRLEPADVERLLRIRRRVGPFLEYCARFPWDQYDVVGFTSTFEQNIASLALARRIASDHPEVLIAFGGANWEGEMGEALHRLFPFVDVVASGEADDSFPLLIKTLAKGGDPAGVPGLVLRGADGSSQPTAPGSPVGCLDDLPIPSYGDFVEQLTSSPAAIGIPPTLLLETSRGCWWGAKHHCTFCGLNGGSMAFRSKSADRVIQEVELLIEAGAFSVAAVDNILDMRYFTTVLPELAKRGAPLQMFYEVKANMTREQVRLLAQSGVKRIQPGIESLSDGVLQLMRKGTTALQNLQLLKWCAEYGVRPEWNFLYGFPGEDPRDYADMARLIPALSHLPPPSGHGPLRLDRFSPYHEDQAGFGLKRVRPFAPYRFLYDTTFDELMRIAYYFEFEYGDRSDTAYIAPALDQVLAWMARPPGGALTFRPHDDGSAVIADSRDGAARGYSLEPWQADLYALADRATSDGSIEGRRRELGIDIERADEFLNACVERQFALHLNGRWLALAVHDPPRWDDHVSYRRELEVLS